MVEQGSGHIVNVASISGLVGHPMGAPYATSKYGVVGLSHSLRAEGAGFGVKVHAVCPGFVRTDFFDAAVVINARREHVISRIPFRMMSAERAAETILLGVERNRAFIVFPFYARVMWWLYRLHPSLTKPFAERMIGDFRAARGISEG
jgi:short-subunit dehydrogenase